MSTPTDIVKDQVTNEDQAPPTRDELVVPDDNQKTFINENLWKKFAFKFLAYLIYTVAMSIIILDWVVGWSWPKFFYGFQFMILPLVWQTLDAQSRNKEIQAKLKADADLAAAKDAAEDAKDERANVEIQLKSTQLELDIVRRQLDDTTKTLLANRDALTTAKTL